MSESSSRQGNARGGGMRGGPGGPGGHGFGAPVQKAKDFKGTLKRLITFLKPHQAKLILVFILAIASTAFTIAAPKVTGQAINKLKDGFIAKSVIEQMIPMQEKAADQIKMVLDSGAAGTLDPQTKAGMEAFLALPELSKATDGETKAMIIEQLIELGKQMPEDGAASESPVKLTDAQIQDAIRAVRETNGRINFDAIGRIALILLAMYFISAGFSLATGLVMSGVAQRTVYDLRKRVDEKLERLPLGYFDRRTHGEVLSRMTNDVDTISTTLQQSLTQLITSVVQLIGFIAMMLSISVSLTLIVLVTMPLYIFSTMFVAKRSQKYFAA
ncbi:MAG: ABC transporter ATP-binding protein, partial [Erysipelotrichaceae bacterium]|nr:ABC transporter ATP-binding protein [Erysipelotrichaceae bacterium]